MSSSLMAWLDPVPSRDRRGLRKNTEPEDRQMAGRGSGGWGNSFQRAAQRRSPVFYGGSRASGGWFSSISGWFLQSERGVARGMAGDARCRVRVRQPGEAMTSGDFQVCEEKFCRRGSGDEFPVFYRGSRLRGFQVLSGFFGFFQVLSGRPGMQSVRICSAAFGGVRRRSALRGGRTGQVGRDRVRQSWRPAVLSSFVRLPAGILAGVYITALVFCVKLECVRLSTAARYWAFWVIRREWRRRRGDAARSRTRPGRSR